jgi:SAM-dependent methyltransferase
MLQRARDKHSGSLALMDVQALALPSNRFDAAVVAFVLFHLPHPDRCLTEVHRVLKSSGLLGSATWGVESMPPANTIWDEELQAAGARAIELPATDNRACCDSPEKMAALLGEAGFAPIKVWRESIEHQWSPEDHFEYQLRSSSRLRLESLGAIRRQGCLDRIRERLSRAGEEPYVYRGEVVLATAMKLSSGTYSNAGSYQR